MSDLEVKTTPAPSAEAPNPWFKGIISAVLGTAIFAAAGAGLGKMWGIKGKEFWTKVGEWAAIGGGSSLATGYIAGARDVKDFKKGQQHIAETTQLQNENEQFKQENASLKAMAEKAIKTEYSHAQQVAEQKLQAEQAKLDGLSAGRV